MNNNTDPKPKKKQSYKLKRIIKETVNPPFFNENREYRPLFNFRSLILKI